MSLFWVICSSYILLMLVFCVICSSYILFIAVVLSLILVFCVICSSSILLIVVFISTITTASSKITQLDCVQTYSNESIVSGIPP